MIPLPSDDTTPPVDYDLFAEGDQLEIAGFADAVANATEATLVNKTNEKYVSEIGTVEPKSFVYVKGGIE